MALQPSHGIPPVQVPYSHDGSANSLVGSAAWPEDANGMPIPAVQVWVRDTLGTTVLTETHTWQEVLDREPLCVEVYSAA